MPIASAALGIDFGTSNTAAVLRTPDGRIRTVLFDGAPQLPSAVFLEEPPGLLVGRDALYAARADPDRLEPNPKQRIDDGTVLLGGAGVPVGDLIAAVLRRVADEATRIVGAVPARAVLTCPAGWGGHRRDLLRSAAGRVFAEVDLVVEPVAAASYFVAVAGSRLAVGACAVVYDLGAGTFDASVVRRTADGFAVLAADGLPDAGGLDIDAVIVGYLGAAYAARDPARWRRLVQPESDADRRLSRQLWDDVRTAKEVLSRATATRVPLPLFDDDAPLGREQFDLLARPVLDRTIAATRGVLSAAGVVATDVAAIYLVGGATRIPLVATMLHQSFGLAPTLVEQPELAVAEGSLRVGSAEAALATGPPLPAQPPPVASPLPAPEWPATAAEAVPSPGIGRTIWYRRGRVRAGLMALLVAVAAGAVTLWVAVAVARGDGQGPGSTDSPRVTTVGTTGGASPAPTSAPPTTAPVALTGKDCVVGEWELVKIVYPNSDFYGTKVSMSGSGMLYSYRRDGTGLTRLPNVSVTGRAAGNRYESIYNGQLSWRYRAGGTTIIYTDGRASGSVVIKVNGSVRESIPMALAAGSTAEYVCDGDGMSLSATEYSAELRRRKAAPAAK